MRILIATDAWHPQVNGVVRTLTSLARSAAALDADIAFLTPEGFPSFGLPTYPGLRVALPNRREISRRIEAAAPDAIHIATEGPVGWSVRAHCRRRKLAFTTSYTTRFPEYVEVRTSIPAGVGYAVLRHFHSAAAMTMVATASLRQELNARGFRRLGFWGRGVDTNLFTPDAPAKLDLPRPIFMTMGRVAVEKNLEAFLALDLPGSKVVIGEGPQRAELQRRFPQAIFLGEKKGADLSSHLAAAD
ncbi:MAG: glycosyltransferase, partial [Bradyrhizobium sp.]|nr:glycosyltransferase [Bradyrhizobium sp.]